MPSLFLLSAVVLVSGMILIDAECPNGCSGRGSCSSKDMCQCYKNYQGNDCSERTCGFGYAHTDTSKGDLDMDQDIASINTLLNSQVYPYGTDELSAGENHEGHFYMECSNQGLCDRESGDCVCFDGFEGSACQRASCPNSCSDHGSCESISEFATKAGGTLYSKGLGGATTYNLWDADVSYGCKCDPWFTGADCSQRLCKVGVDPMYYDTDSLTYETIAIVIIGNKAQIRFWDYWGESYITEEITFDGTDNAALIEAALEALPNGVISDQLECTASSFFGSSLDSVECQFRSNPGALRLPEVFSGSIEIRGTPLRGEDENLCARLATLPSAVSSGTTLQSGTNPAEITAFTTGEPQLWKVGDAYVVITEYDSGTNLYTMAAATTLPASDIYISDATVTAIVGSSDGAVTFSAVTFSASAGATTLVSSLTVKSQTIAAGDKIICENQILNVVSITDTDTTSTITVDRPVYGLVNNGDNYDSNSLTKCYEIENPQTSSTYVSECSARGLCDRESGVCACFKGYTNDNCDKQSILAF